MDIHPVVYYIDNGILYYILKNNTNFSFNDFISPIHKSSMGWDPHTDFTKSY